MNELMKFQDKEVEVFEFKGQVLFNPNHVGDCLSIKNVRDSISGFNPKQIIKLKNSDVANTDIRKLNNAGENFLTESGVYKLIFQSRKEEAEKFQDWVTDEVLPQIRKTGGYIPIDQNMSEAEIMAKALMIAQNTISKKDELINNQAKQLEEQRPKVDFVNHIATSSNSLLVREVAKIASKKGIKIGERKLYEKLRSWEMVFKNTCEATQKAIEQGILEIVEGAKENSKGTFTFKTTKVTGKGQVYIINRLIKEGF